MTVVSVKRACNDETSRRALRYLYAFALDGGDYFLVIFFFLPRRSRRAAGVVRVSSRRRTRAARRRGGARGACVRREACRGRFARSRGTVSRVERRSRRRSIAASRGRRGRLGGGGRPSLLLPRGRPRCDRRRRPRGPDALHPAVAPGRGLAAGRAPSRAHRAPPGALREHPHEGDFPPDARPRRRGARAQPPLEDWRHFIYSTRMLGGVELGRVDHFDEKGSERGSVEISPTSVAHPSQHRLEPMLLARALEAHPRAPPGSRCAPSASGSRRTTPGSPPSFDSTMRTMREMVKSTVKFTVVRLSRARRRFAARSWSRRTAPAAARGRGWASPSPARPPCSTS